VSSPCDGEKTRANVVISCGADDVCCFQSCAGQAEGSACTSDVCGMPQAITCHSGCCDTGC
jgi:hypothetical protein